MAASITPSGGASPYPHRCPAPDTVPPTAPRTVLSPTARAPHAPIPLHAALDAQISPAPAATSSSSPAKPSHASSAAPANESAPKAARRGGPSPGSNPSSSRGSGRGRRQTARGRGRGPPGPQRRPKSAAATTASAARAPVETALAEAPASPNGDAPASSPKQPVTSPVDEVGATAGGSKATNGVQVRAGRRGSGFNRAV